MMLLVWKISCKDEGGWKKSFKTLAMSLNITMSTVIDLKMYRWKVHGTTAYCLPNKCTMQDTLPNDKEGKRRANSHLKRVAG